MKKAMCILLAAIFIIAALPVMAEEMTPLGTPRRETLIVETATSMDNPGQFNPYMIGTNSSFGLQQLIFANLWEMNSMKGEQFGEIADGMPESNADYTEHIVHIRKGIKWSDGVDLTAHDVVFTIKMIMNNPNISSSSYYNSVFKSVEALDDYTVKLVTKEFYPRLTQKFGVTICANDLRIMPKHVFENVEDPSTFKYENPVVAGPYTVKDYDPLGKWIMFERRPDWEHSTVGVVTGKMPAPKYVWFRFMGDDTTRQMTMIRNEADVLCEVTPEMLKVMQDANPNIHAWYDGFPYAMSDDPAGKGVTVMMGGKQPFSNTDFRWGLALAMDKDEMSMNVFDGIGRASCFPIITATSFMQDMYFEPLEEWLENDLVIDLGDGTSIHPFDTDYAERMADRLGIQGTEKEKEDIFGIGTWKCDPEAAEKLFIKAGLEKIDGKWYYNGEPFVLHLSYLADAEAESARIMQAAYDQLMKFGFDCTIESKSTATWNSDGSRGYYELAGYWPTGGITRDIYTQAASWDPSLNTPIGETTTGQGFRWQNDEIPPLIQKLAKVAPDSDESYELGKQILKIAIKDIPFIGILSGTKFVPTNNTYWTNFPNSGNPYNGPWWWWSCFKYILPELKQTEMDKT